MFSWHLFLTLLLQHFLPCFHYLSCALSTKFKRSPVPLALSMLFSNVFNTVSDRQWDSNAELHMRLAEFHRIYLCLSISIKVLLLIEPVMNIPTHSSVSVLYDLMAFLKLIPLIHILRFYSWFYFLNKCLYFAIVFRALLKLARQIMEDF